jgi:hypothetical protein
MGAQSSLMLYFVFYIISFILNNIRLKQFLLPFIGSINIWVMRFNKTLLRESCFEFY